MLRDVQKDPVSGESVDKASAVIIQDATGRVLYFASEDTAAVSRVSRDRHPQDLEAVHTLVDIDPVLLGPAERASGVPFSPLPIAVAPHAKGEQANELVAVDAATQYSSPRVATYLWFRFLALAGPADPDGLDVPLDDLGALVALHRPTAAASSAITLDWSQTRTAEAAGSRFRLMAGDG